MSRKTVLTLGILVLLALILFVLLKSAKVETDPVRVGIAPYQDLAMIVNAEPLGLEEKYGTEIEIVTLAWEDILPSVASAGRTVDIGFGSYIEFLTKYKNINDGDSDPVLFLYPAYVFRGGAFVSFNPDIPRISNSDFSDTAKMKSLLSKKIGAQKGSIYEMALFKLAEEAGVNPGEVNLIDTPLDQGFLAAERGSLDLAAVGLTQLTEATRRNGNIVFSIDDLGFADITGFIIKKSTWDERPEDIKNVIRMWFDSVDFVYSDIDANSVESLKYLNKTSSTRYSLEEYKTALSQEYLPRSIPEIESAIIDGQKYSYIEIGETANRFLISNNVIREKSPLPTFPEIDP